MLDTTIVTNEIRVSYEHLTKAYANQPGAEPKFSATILLPKSDVETKQRMDNAIRAAIERGVASTWGMRPAQPALPVYDGDGVRPNGEPFGPECKGHWVFTASTKTQPEIIDAQMNPVINPAEIYSGMYARVCVNFFPYLNSGKRGIGCGLGPVQKTRDGDPLGNHITAAEAFGSMAAAPAFQQPVTAQKPVTVNPLTGMPM